MKKIFFIILIPLIIVFISLLSLFLNPELVINKKNLDWAIKKWSPYEQSIGSFEFKHQRLSWFERNIEVTIKDFEISTTKDMSKDFQAHLKKMTLTFRLYWDGQWKVESRDHNEIVFKNISFTLPETNQSEGVKTKPIFNVGSTYALFWKKIIPEFDLSIEQLEIKNKNGSYKFPLTLKRTYEKLEAQLHELSLVANPEQVTLILHEPAKLWTLISTEIYPPSLKKLRIELLFQLVEKNHPLQIKMEALGGTAELNLLMPNLIDLEHEENLIEELISTLEIQVKQNHLSDLLVPFMNKEISELVREQEINAKIETVLTGQKRLHGKIGVQVESLVEIKSRSITLNFLQKTDSQFKTSDLLKNHENLLTSLLLGTQVDLKIDQLNDKWKTFENSLFQLPAPLNSLDGHLLFNLAFQEGSKNNLDALFNISIDLTGHEQNLILSSQSKLPLNKSNLTPNGPLQTQVELERVNLRLPDWQAEAKTPQLLPDSRIILNSQSEIKPISKQTKQSKINMNMHLKTESKKPMTIATNLLQEDIRLNFNIQIKQSVIKTGWLEVMPLKLEIFKRKIYLKSLRLDFQAPLLPQLTAEIHFDLPEYLITLNLEGTTSQIRHHFRSTPPLPQSDIYAVLLFGRPLTELSDSDRTATNQTQQLLSDGLLSLSVLYFLSGGPIESIGFNPETGSVSAQLGLSKKSSLTLSTSSSGEKRASVRRNLGKGWSINTSIQNNTQIPSGSQQDYGVLLEKIMAY